MGRKSVDYAREQGHGKTVALLERVEAIYKVPVL